MELSRLEGMITSANVTRPSYIENEIIHRRRESISTERQDSIVEGGNQGASISTSGPLPNHCGESSTARHSDIAFASRRRSFDRIRENLDFSGRSQQTREMATARSVESDYHIFPTDYRSFVEDPDNIRDRSIEKPAREENKSSVLYAVFSKEAQPRQLENPTFEIDYGTIHRILRQSLATVYPSEVVEYVSLRRFITLCEDHMELLHQRPNVQMSPKGKAKEVSYVVNENTPASSRPPMISLRDRLVELRKAIKVSRGQCIQAGYSLSELDNLLSPTGSGSYAPANHPPPMPGTDGEDDNSSIYSEDYHSFPE